MKYGSNLIIGDIGEADVNASKQMRDVTKALYSVYPKNEESPYLALLMRLTAAKMENAQRVGRNVRRAYNVKHEWIKKDFFPRWDTITTVDSGNGTTSVTITPANIDYYRVGDAVEFFSATHYYGYVHAKTSTQLTIKPVDGTTALTLAANDPVHIYSTSNEELSNSPTGKSVKTEFEYNYPQFMRYPTTIGIFELGTKQYSGWEEDERIQEQFSEIRMSAERMLHFGERGKTTGPNGETLVFSRGMKRWSETAGADNVLDWSGGSLTESTFREWLMSGPCKYGSKRKFFPMSTELWMQIDSWANTKQNIQAAGGVIDILGMSFTKYMAPNGRILFMHHHHMYEQQYEGAGQIIDLEGVNLLPFGENPVFSYHPNIQDPDVAGKKHEWRFLATLEVPRSEWHGYIHR
jgi:hypothetical protein